MTYLIVNSIAILLIIFILWWFFGKRKAQVMNGNQLISIVVQNGIYQPAIIQVSADQPIQLQFLRKDPSACAETVIFPTLNIAQTLPLNQKIRIDIPKQNTGEIPFHCQMNMYRGKII